MSRIYKILGLDDWEAARLTGLPPGSGLPVPFVPSVPFVPLRAAFVLASASLRDEAAL